MERTLEGCELDRNNPVLVETERPQTNKEKFVYKGTDILTPEEHPTSGSR